MSSMSLTKMKMRSCCWTKRKKMSSMTKTKMSSMSLTKMKMRSCLIKMRSCSMIPKMMIQSCWMTPSWTSSMRSCSGSMSCWKMSSMTMSCSKITKMSSMTMSCSKIPKMSWMMSLKMMRKSSPPHRKHRR